MARKIPAIFWMVMTIGCGFSATALKAQTLPSLSAAEILQKYQQSLLPLRKFTAKWSDSSQWNGGSQELTNEVRVNGDNFMIKTNRTEKYQNQTDNRLDEQIRVGDKFITVSIATGSGRWKHMQIGRADSQARFALYSNMRMVFGFLDIRGDRTVAQVLTDAKDLHVIDTPAQVQGVAVRTIQGTTPAGIVTLSIGPSDGIARQITIEKHKGNSDYYGRLMGDNDPLYEGTTPTTEKLLWHDVKIKTVDGKPFAYAGKLTIDDDYPRLGKRQWVQPFELQEIHLNPDMTTAFIPDAPEGIRVFNAEDRETQYVWHNGHVIKRADLRSAVAADAKVPGLVWTDWRVIAFACLILLTIPITLVSWYVRRRKPKAA